MPSVTTNAGNSSLRITAPIAAVLATYARRIATPSTGVLFRQVAVMQAARLT